MTARQLRIGVAGLGRAFTLMLPTLRGDPRVVVAAAADPREPARALFTSEFNAPSYASVEELCADPGVEVVYVATPHQHHAEHVRLAAERGKHVLVEKPMAISIQECQTMIEAAKAANIILVVGHSHSFNAPVLRARAIIASGRYGKVRMINAMNYTDFLYRPRRPEELDTSRGGGVVISQAAHQIDIVRLLGGGRLRSVHAMTGTWDRARPTEGAYGALLTFTDEIFASVVYSGYGRFDSDEMTNWIGEMGLPKDRAGYGNARRALQSASDVPENELKAARSYGGAEYSSSPGATSGRAHQHFGLIIASCEGADLRLQPDGVMIYEDLSAHLDAVPVPAVPRSEVIDELYSAVIEGKAPLHGGEWSLATMEVCFAILESARQKKEILLTRQVELPTEPVGSMA